MIPRERFAHLPTPVESLPRLTEHLDGPRLLVKRDDQTGLAFGGNKTRKLETLLAEARKQGARSLITSGAVQSNHCRQTAAAAARFGLECTLVLTGPQPDSLSANLQLDHLFGARIVWADPRPRDEVMNEVYERARANGEQPYLVPYGGSSPTGAAAYALALEELLDQKVRPEWIVLATSSGGTQAGLMAGQARLNFEGQILGISVDKATSVLQPGIARLAGEVSELLASPSSFAPEEVQIKDNYVGQGYGRPGAPDRKAIRLLARLEGLLLDPVYTGRAAAGLIDLIRQGFFAPNQTVLFWHTGGTPGLFADRYRDFLNA